MPFRNPSNRSSVGSIGLAVRLWREYLSRYWPKLAISLVAMALYAASASAIPAGVEAINAAFTGVGEGRAGALIDLDPARVVIWGPLLIIALGGANALSQYVQARLSAFAALAALRDLQVDVYAALTQIDDAQLRSLGSGQAAARLTNDAMVLRDTLTRASTAARDLLTLIGLLGVMLYYDWALFLVVFIVYPALGWPVSAIGRYLRKRSREAQEQAGEIASLAMETVGGGRIIRAYGLEGPMQGKAQNAFDERLGVLRRMAHLRALNEPFIFFVGAVALSIIVAVVAVRIEAGALNISELVSFIIALLLLSQPARGLSTLNAVAQEGFGALERMTGLIDLEPEVRERDGAAPLRVERASLSFSDVSFSYTEGVNALNGLSFDARGGERLALVGESGAGKSTVFNLILRLYDPDSGNIEVDGQNIRNLTISSLRGAVAIVSQEATLFDDTVAANIRFGRLEAPEGDVIAAAKAAAADGFIRELPNGYETRVGEGGQNLSGGQRQRIAIARAFLKDAPILLLDEATSALDAETERQVQEALDRLADGRTTIVIAHRLSTVVSADRILLMEKGRVVAEGDHATLLERSSDYARLAKLQLAG
ncbi:MAG: ABC transporter ATP-binding protein [Pseudomonadota bacterium]